MFPPVTPGRTGCRRPGLCCIRTSGGCGRLFEDMARRLATHGLAVCAVEPFARCSRRSVRSTSSQRHGAREGSRRRCSSWTCCRPRPICWSSKTTCRGCRCSASAWAGTTCSRPRRSIASTPRSRSTACCARPTRGRARATDRAARGRRRDVPDARDLRHERPVDADRRHRRAARRVGGSQRLRDRRRRRRRARLRARPRTPTRTAPTTPAAPSRGTKRQR